MLSASSLRDPPPALTQSHHLGKQSLEKEQNWRRVTESVALFCGHGAFLFFFFFIAVELIYNVVLVLGVQLICPFLISHMSARLKYINSQHLLSDYYVYYRLSQNPTSPIVTLFISI